MAGPPIELGAGVRVYGNRDRGWGEASDTSTCSSSAARATQIAEVMPDLYPETEPYDDGMLEVGDGNSV